MPSKAIRRKPAKIIERVLALDPHNAPATEALARMGR